jgi:hypothetical protein
MIRWRRLPTGRACRYPASVEATFDWLRRADRCVDLRCVRTRIDEVLDFNGEIVGGLEISGLPRD